MLLGSPSDYGWGYHSRTGSVVASLDASPIIPAEFEKSGVIGSAFRAICKESALGLKPKVVKCVKVRQGM